MMWWMLATLLLFKSCTAAIYGGIIQYPMYHTEYVPVHYQVPHYLSYIQPPQIRYSTPFIPQYPLSIPPYNNYYPWWHNTMPRYYGQYPWHNSPPYYGQYPWHNMHPYYGHYPWWRSTPWYYGHYPWYHGNHPWHHGYPWWYSSHYYNGPPQRSLWWWMNRQHNPYWYLYHHQQFPNHQHPWWWYRLHFGNGHYPHPWWWYWSHHSQPTGYNGYYGRGSLGGYYGRSNGYYGNGYYGRSNGYYGNGYYGNGYHGIGYHGNGYYGNGYHGNGYNGGSNGRYINGMSIGRNGNYWNQYVHCPRHTIHMHHLDTRSWWTCRHQDPSLCLAELTLLTNNMIRSNRCRRHSCPNLHFSREDLQWLMYRYRHLLPMINDRRVPFSRRMLIMANLILSKLNRWCYYDTQMMQLLTHMVWRRHYYYIRYHHNMHLGNHWWSTQRNLWHSAGWWGSAAGSLAASRAAMGMSNGYNGWGYYGGRWSPYSYYSGGTISGGVPGQTQRVSYPGASGSSPGASQSSISSAGSNWSSPGSFTSNSPGSGSTAPGGVIVNTPSNTQQLGTLRQRESCKLCSKQLSVINNRLQWLLSAGSQTQQQLSYISATRDNLLAKLPKEPKTDSLIGQHNAMIQQLTNQMNWLSWRITRLRGYVERKGCIVSR